MIAASIRESFARTGATSIRASSPSWAAACQRWAQRLERGRTEPGGAGEDDHADRDDQQRRAHDRGQQQASSLDRPREHGRDDPDREEPVGGVLIDEDPAEREADGHADQDDRDEGRQTLDASSRSRGVCHRSLEPVDGVRTRRRNTPATTGSSAKPIPTSSSPPEPISRATSHIATPATQTVTPRGVNI
jgi:hypothetical protein